MRCAGARGGCEHPWPSLGKQHHLVSLHGWHSRAQNMHSSAWREKKRGKSSAGKVPGVSQGGTERSRSWPRVLAEKKRLNDFLGCMRQCIHCRSGGVILPLCSAPVCWVQGCAPQWERSQKGGLVEVYKYPKGQWSLAVFSGAQCQDNGHKLGHKSFCPSIPKIFFIVQDLRRSLPTIR